MLIPPSHPDDDRDDRERGSEPWRGAVPPPSPLFRRRAWREFQRALDPLAPPKPLPTRQPPQRRS